MKSRSIFWQRQPALPWEIRKFLQDRLVTALREPERRTLLVWPALLGSPLQRMEHPLGIPEPRLLVLAQSMLQAVSIEDPASVWKTDVQLFPDTAGGGPWGWIPHPQWDAFSTLVSLRSAMGLMALTGGPGGDRYLLSSAIALFNLSMFHECHEALEPLWRRAEGPLKTGLQGLILLTCGFHHQQHHNFAGMRSTWKGGIPHLGPSKGTLDTPWGQVDYAGSLDMVRLRSTWALVTDEDMVRFWETPPPRWELK